MKRREDGLTVDWTRADTDYIYGNKSYKGWCNVDAKEVYENKFHVKSPQCDCKYDGRWGVVCESPSESFCINQCNDNGFCQQGYCAVSFFTFPSMLQPIFSSNPGSVSSFLFSLSNFEYSAYSSVLTMLRVLQTFITSRLLCMAVQERLVWH